MIYEFGFETELHDMKDFVDMIFDCKPFSGVYTKREGAYHISAVYLKNGDVFDIEVYKDKIVYRECIGNENELTDKKLFNLFKHYVRHFKEIKED